MTSQKCAWIITLGDDDKVSQALAQQLSVYGLQPQGQRWPNDNSSQWLASAQAASDAHADVVIIAGETARLSDPALRRQIALFHLSLETLRDRCINGFILGSVPLPARPSGVIGLLDHWLQLPEVSVAKIVARAHAPTKPAWPVSLRLQAHERFGTWFEVHPEPGQTAAGALLGVNGPKTTLSFHAVGAKGALPSTTTNAYELKGLQFEVRELPFEAWALQNPITPDERYYVRFEGEPDFLAVGNLPQGNVDTVHLLFVG